MKKYFILFSVLLLSGTCLAVDFYQTNNPFPQTSMQNLNNIYESEPSVINHEETQQKRSKFKKRNKHQNEFSDNKPVNEIRNDGSFHVFPSR